MAGFDFFDRQLQLATADLEPAAINAALAKFARQEVAKAIAGGASPVYDRFVNGREGLPEDAVHAPGPIVYEFINWPLIVGTALEELRRRVPSRSGRYAASFMVLANQAPVADFRSIPAEAEVIVFNTQPYTRKIEVGANKTGKKHFDLTRASLSRRFGAAFKFETRFLNIKTGVAPGVPYILKRSRTRRKDRAAGQALTYPAIVINAL
jgi:hypothetical protein